MTGFIASAFLSRNRVSLKDPFEGLELCEGKLSRTVLRGLDGSNPVRLLGKPSGIGAYPPQLLHAIIARTDGAHSWHNPRAV
jgi:hypothetical protein